MTDKKRGLLTTFLGYIGIGTIVASAIFVFDGRLTLAKGAVISLLGAWAVGVGFALELRRNPEVKEWVDDVITAAMVGDKEAVKNAWNEELE